MRWSMPVVAKLRAGMDESNIDHQRGERTGLSEVVFAENKTGEQTLEIASTSLRTTGFRVGDTRRCGYRTASVG